MIRFLIAVALAVIPAAAGCTPKAKKPPTFSCTRDDIPGPVKAHLRDGRISWIGVHGEEHAITGTRDEWRWSCIPDDGRVYPIDTE